MKCGKLSLYLVVLTINLLPYEKLIYILTLALTVSLSAYSVFSYDLTMLMELTSMAFLIPGDGTASGIMEEVNTNRGSNSGHLNIGYTHYYNSDFNGALTSALHQVMSTEL